MDNCFADFLVDKGLYDTAEITKENIGELCDLLDGKIRFDIYCPECKERRVFRMGPVTFDVWTDSTHTQKKMLGEQLRELQGIQRAGVSGTKEWFWNNRDCAEATHIIVCSLFCAMDSTHRIDYVVQTEGNLMRKIGQYPSLADLTFPELKNYRKVINSADLSELKRAIGLHAQGIGVGSYVYLRRIFERIIDIAKNQAISDNSITQEDYDKSRMAEKIKLLSDYLPKILVETPEFYGIVSKGIHELSEDDCIAYFPIMQEVILMILREWEEKRKAAETEKHLKASLSKIASKVK